MQQALMVMGTIADDWRAAIAEIDRLIERLRRLSAARQMASWEAKDRIKWLQEIRELAARMLARCEAN